MGAEFQVFYVEIHDDMQIYKLCGYLIDSTNLSHTHIDHIVDNILTHVDKKENPASSVATSCNWQSNEWCVPLPLSYVQRRI